MFLFEEEEEESTLTLTSLQILELFVILKDKKFVNSYKESNNNLLTSLASNIVNGVFLDSIDLVENSPLSFSSLISDAYNSDFYTLIRNKLISYFNEDDSSDIILDKFYHIFYFGISLLELYTQVNYTGPELINTQRARIEKYINFDLKKNIIQNLECDGSYTFPLIELPELLLLARCLLSFVSDFKKETWKEGIKLNSEGKVERIFIANLTNKELTIYNSLQSNNKNLIISSSLWNARAIILHARSLQGLSEEAVPTLWKEVVANFHQVFNQLNDLSEYTSLENLVKNSTKLLELELNSPLFSAKPDEISEDEWTDCVKIILSECWLEFGLACHYFSIVDKGKGCFQMAKRIAQLEVTLTAAFGKRTKHQKEDFAQLLVKAVSSIKIYNRNEKSEKKFTGEKIIQRAKVTPDNELGTINEGDEEKDEDNTGWDYGKYELGKRVVNETQSGEEVAVREVLLDETDGGAKENVIIEGGPKFSEENVDKGNELHPIDQAIILSLCLDVSNSNPMDGLTNEEMIPYIERILTATSTNSNEKPADNVNWMIYSTALLERSWIEFNRRKTMDRAMLQIQALIDQHCTRLTVTQSTYHDIENSAPAEDRLKYIYSIVYPSQFELKRDLALKYLQCQVFASALNYFQELQMWDEVVTCYQLLQKPYRAELVVREQLKINESPYMLTSLADLTGDLSLYEKAWEVSNKRFARAKRTLGKILHDKGDYENSIRHYTEALRVQPLVHTAWYLKGVGCMFLEKFDEGIESFVRCVQLDAEVGEAWSNMGSIHMRRSDFQKAHHCLSEAYKVKRDNWKVLENLMFCTFYMRKYPETLLHMTTLLGFHMKSHRPYHLTELRQIAIAASTLSRSTDFDLVSEADEEDDQNKEGEVETIFSSFRSEEKDTVPLSSLAVSLEKFLNKVVQTIKPDPLIFDLLAVFYAGHGHYKTALENRMKEVRLFFYSC